MLTLSGQLFSSTTKRFSRTREKRRGRHSPRNIPYSCALIKAHTVKKTLSLPLGRGGPHMVTRLSRVFRIKRRVSSWQTKKTQNRERCRGEKKRSTQLHGIFAVHQRPGMPRNGIERSRGWASSCLPSWFLDFYWPHDCRRGNFKQPRNLENDVQRIRFKLIGSCRLCFS